MRAESGIVAEGRGPSPRLLQREDRLSDGGRRLRGRLERGQLREVRDAKAGHLHRPGVAQGRGHDVRVDSVGPGDDPEDQGEVLHPPGQGTDVGEALRARRGSR